MQLTILRLTAKIKKKLKEDYSEFTSLFVVIVELFVSNDITYGLIYWRLYNNYIRTKH